MPAFSVFAHDFDNVSDEDIAPAGKLNIRGAKTSNLKVLVKYPTVTPNSTMTAEILLSDLLTKQPVSGVNITAIFNFIPEKEPSSNSVKPIFVTALPTEAIGNYLVSTSLPQAGNYRLTLMMSKNGLNAQVILPNIIIPIKVPIAQTHSTSPYDLSRYFIAIAVIVFFSISSVIALSNRRSIKRK